MCAYTYYQCRELFVPLLLLYLKYYRLKTGNFTDWDLKNFVFWIFCFIQKVPIADKVYPFFENWYNMDPDCKYLIHTDKSKKFEHWNYINTYFKPLLKNIGAKEECTPHHTRHTCISMLKDAKVEETTIKKIVGHKGAMSLTEKVYTHLDMSVLHEAINKI